MVNRKEWLICFIIFAGFQCSYAFAQTDQSKSCQIAANSITIDESREDWADIDRYPLEETGNNGGGISKADWDYISMAHDCDDLFVRYEVSDGMKYTYRYNLLLDIDQQRDTGYIGYDGSYSVGAELLVQGSSDGNIVAIFEFIGNNQSDWSWNRIYHSGDEPGFSSTVVHNKELPGNKWDIELKISLIPLVKFNLTAFDWIAVIDNGFENFPDGVNDFYPDNGNNPSNPYFYTYTLSYTPPTATFPNPERGFYEGTETHSGKERYAPLDFTTLQCYRKYENTTLVHRFFYLDDFFDQADISQEYLSKVQQDFDTIRDAGLKAVVRFAYTNKSLTPPIGDASKEIIIGHISQLAEILEKNSDVIAVLQDGFIGTFGEWWYSDHFSPDDDYPDRRDIHLALLEALPKNRMAQLRAPRYKQNIFESFIPTSKSLAHSGEEKTRTGHHNDCFLASSDDFGTYVNLTDEYPYLSEDTKYAVMGGETCDDTSSGTSRADCDTAEEELALFHWSYLNLNWYEPTLFKWRLNGCFSTIEKKLGYRFIFEEISIPGRKIFRGQRTAFSLKIKNEGYAAPYNPREVKLILRPHGESGVSPYAITLYDPASSAEGGNRAGDPQFWLPEEQAHMIDYTVKIPRSIPPGSYDLLLHLPDPEKTLNNRPEYSIRLANDNIWEENTGYNNLNYTINVRTTPMPHIYMLLLSNSNSRRYAK